MHSSIQTGRFLYGCKFSPNCNYCGEFDDVTHNFVTCSPFRKLTPTIDTIPI